MLVISTITCPCCGNQHEVKKTAYENWHGDEAEGEIFAFAWCHEAGREVGEWLPLLTKLCDSNFGEANVSFAPLVAWSTVDGRVVVQNTAVDRRDGFLGEEYSSLAEAAEARGFIRRFLAMAS